MTYEEAKQNISNTHIQFGRNNGKTVFNDSLSMAIKAIDKQIPQKPLEVVYPWAMCPSCSGSVSLENVQEYLHNQETSYCEHCGQALDWNE